MARKQKGNSVVVTAVLLVIAIGIVLVAVYFSNQNQGQMACTADAKLCPDGTYVGRTGPNCEFSPCPDCLCPQGYRQDGDICNPACYYSNPRCLMPSIQCENRS